MNVVLDDTYYMSLALKEAQKAFEKDEVPIGAVVISQDGVLLGKGHNQVEKRKQQQAHAEMQAIARASQKIQDWRLNGCWLYVTLQPCNMCMGLIQLSRLQGVVYGAPSKLFGYQLDKQGQLQLYNRDIAIKKDILSTDSVALLKQFFETKRKHRGST